MARGTRLTRTNGGKPRTAARGPQRTRSALRPLRRDAEPGADGRHPEPPIRRRAALCEESPRSSALSSSTIDSRSSPPPATIVTTFSLVSWSKGRGNNSAIDRASTERDSTQRRRRARPAGEPPGCAPVARTSDVLHVSIFVSIERFPGLCVSHLVNASALLQGLCVMGAPHSGRSKMVGAERSCRPWTSPRDRRDAAEDMT